MIAPQAPARRRPARLGALGWALGVTAAEWAGRRLWPRRGEAWLATYSALLVAGLAAIRRSPRGARLPPSPISRRTADPPGPTEPFDRQPPLLLGAVMAVVGYPLGRLIAGDRPDKPPSEPAITDTLVIAGVVAPAEELVWGRLVEPRIGVIPTAALFAAKHAVLDGRWRRTLGLGLFWSGLGLVRRRSPLAALGLHVACNAGGVALGRIVGLDQF